MKQLYLKLVEKLDTKKTGVLTGILFVVSLVPIIYVGFFNYATGDDYWYGVHTYRGWVENGLIGALKGSVQTVAEFYENWQGTWFTMFLFTLSPNHFWEEGYVVTVFLSLGLLISSFAYLAHFYLVKKLNFTKGATASITCMVLYLVIQYMPRTTSGIFWFNGIMHYSVPLFLGVLAVIHTHKFVESKKIKDYIILFLCFTLLGGGSYLAPLSASLAAGLILFYQLEIQEFDWKNKKIKLHYDWRNLWVLLAFGAELAGLAVSFLAPGNNVRGGEEFGFSIKWALECVYYAIDRGIYLGVDYFAENKMNLLIFILIAFLVWSQLWRTEKEKCKFRYPLLFVIYINGVYWASYTPEIYSRSDVSGGVPNTYMQFFFLVTLANIVYVHGWLQRVLRNHWQKKSEKTGKEAEKNSVLGPVKYKKYILVPVTILGTVICLATAWHADIMTTNEYCIDYILSGRMEQYKEIRQEQHRILSDESITDAIVPEMEPDYPVLHMRLSKSAEAARNIDRAKYYNKNSVKAELVE